MKPTIDTTPDEHYSARHKDRETRKRTRVVVEQTCPRVAEYHEHRAVLILLGYVRHGLASKTYLQMQPTARAISIDAFTTYPARTAFSSPNRFPILREVKLVFLAPLETPLDAPNRRCDSQGERRLECRGRRHKQHRLRRELDRSEPAPIVSFPRASGVPMTTYMLAATALRVHDQPPITTKRE